MSGYVHSKRYYQRVENVWVYQEANNQLHLSCFSGDIAEISKLLILGTWDMLDYAHPE